MSKKHETKPLKQPAVITSHFIAEKMKEIYVNFNLTTWIPSHENRSVKQFVSECLDSDISMLEELTDKIRDLRNTIVITNPEIDEF